MPKKGGGKSPNTNEASPGRTPKNWTVGKQPTPDKQRTADSRAKIGFQRTTKRWFTCLCSGPGVILEFMARKILLVVMLSATLSSAAPSSSALWASSLPPSLPLLVLCLVVLAAAVGRSVSVVPVDIFYQL